MFAVRHLILGMWSNKKFLSWILFFFNSPNKYFLSICSVPSIVLDMGGNKVNKNKNKKNLPSLPSQSLHFCGEKKKRQTLTKSNGKIRNWKVKCWEDKAAEECEIGNNARGSFMHLTLPYASFGLCCEVVTKLFPRFWIHSPHAHTQTQENTCLLFPVISLFSLLLYSQSCFFAPAEIPYSARAYGSLQVSAHQVCLFPSSCFSVSFSVSFSFRFTACM